MTASEELVHVLGTSTAGRCMVARHRDSHPAASRLLSRRAPIAACTSPACRDGWPRPSLWLRTPHGGAHHRQHAMPRASISMAVAAPVPMQGRLAVLAERREQPSTAAWSFRACKTPWLRRSLTARCGRSRGLPHRDSATRRHDRASPGIGCQSGERSAAIIASKSAASVAVRRFHGEPDVGTTIACALRRRRSEVLAFFGRHCIASPRHRAPNNRGRG